jgi:hypothetical protein
MTALFCRIELAVGNLMHIDRYFQQYGLQFTGRKRADLFGLSPNGWVVAEAKATLVRWRPTCEASWY